jgi:hypothetical protein
MVLLPGDLERMLSGTAKTQLSCPKCGSSFTFEDGAARARDGGIPDNVVVCPGCAAVYEVDVRPSGTSLGADVTDRY